jgi:hypothetical protein
VRTRIARAMAVLGALALAVLVATDAPWWLGAALFFPVASVAAIAFLEARASVCVVGAAQGVYEDDRRDKTPMDAGSLPAIRRVALSLTVKAILLAAAVTVGLILTVFRR